MKQRGKLTVGDVVDMTGRISGQDLDLGRVISVNDDEVVVVPENDAEEPLNLIALDDELFPMPVMRFDAWGYVNKKGEIVLPFDYDFAAPFKKGKACVALLTNRDIYFYINTCGEWVRETQERRDDESVVYVLQYEYEGNSSGENHKTVVGVYSKFEDAAAHLKQRRNMHKKYDALFEDESPALFDQPDCFWDRSHYITIQEKSVRKINKGDSVFCVSSITKANVIELPSDNMFFSCKKEMLDFLNASIDKNNIIGVADLDSREAQTESEEYTIGVFVLQ